MGERGSEMVLFRETESESCDMTPTPIEIVGTVLFAVAVAHTFLTKYFERLARLQPAHAGIWHLLGEVEVVFGFWAFVFILFYIAHTGTEPATHYLESLSYTEPMFVFVIMVIAASKPILDLADLAITIITNTNIGSV